MKWLLIVVFLLNARPLAAASLPANMLDHAARFAIVIGKNEPEETQRETLRYADDDAVSMHQLFQEAGIKSVLFVSPDQDTVAIHRISYPRKPRRDAVLRAVDVLFEQIETAKQEGQQTEFILYYSGHGEVADGEGFVVLDSGRLTRTDLLEQIIARSPAHTNHVIIDACKSYYMVFNKGPGGERRPFQREFAPSVSENNLDRTGFILSASSNEDSHEWERYQAGVFSYEVRSALRGGADANQDGRITYGELGAFVTTANKGIVNPKFRPDFLVSPPGRAPENLRQALLRWNDKSGSLTVDDTAAGHLFIETQDGVRIADVHPDRAQQLTVHLPRSRPLFVRWVDNRKEMVLYSHKPVRLSTLNTEQTTIARKGALSVAFESLFSVPFGNAVVDTYESTQFRLHTRRTVRRAPISDTPAGLKPLRQSLFGVSLGALVIGGTMSIVGLNRLKTAEDSPQEEIPELNRQIDIFNTTAAVFYGIAATAGMSWLTLKLLYRKGRKRQIAFSSMATPTGLTLGLHGVFGYSSFNGKEKE